MSQSKKEEGGRGLTSCCNCGSMFGCLVAQAWRQEWFHYSFPPDFFFEFVFKFQFQGQSVVLVCSMNTFLWNTWRIRNQRKKRYMCCCLPATGRRSISRLPPSRSRKKSGFESRIFGRTHGFPIGSDHTQNADAQKMKKKTRVGVKCHRTHFAAASVPPPLQFMCSIREIQVPPYLYFFPFLSSSEGGDALMWLMAIAPPRATSSMRRRRKRRDSGVSSNKYTTATPRIAVREMYMRTHF